MTDCKVEFGPDDSISDKDKMKAIMDTIEDLRRKSKGPEDFSRKAATFLRNIQREAKINEKDRLDAANNLAYNMVQVEERAKAFTDKKGRIDFVSLYKSFFVAEGKVAGNLKSYNLESINSVTQEHFVRILDKYLGGKTIMDRVANGDAFAKAVHAGAYTKDAFRYLFSGGKIQVDENAIKLASMIKEIAETGLRLKKDAGFLEEGIENYFIRQSRAYDPKQIKGREEEFVEEWYEALDKDKSFPDLEEDVAKEMLTKIAYKISANVDRIFSDKDIQKEVSDFFSSNYKRRYAQRRKFVFKDGESFYNIYSKYGENDIVTSLFREARLLSSDVSFKTVFGPLADQQGYGRDGLKTELVKKIREKMKSDPDNMEYYKKQSDNLNRKSDMVSLGYLGLLTERAILDNITGEVHRPANQTMADLGNLTRTVVAAQILGRSVLASIADYPSALNRISEISGKNIFSAHADILDGMLAVIKSPELRQKIMDDINIPSESSFHNELKIMHSQTPLAKAGNYVGAAFNSLNPLTYSQRMLRTALGYLDSQYLAKAVKQDFASLDGLQRAVMTQYGIDANISALARDYAVVNYQGKDLVLTDMFYNIPDEELKKVNLGAQFNNAEQKRGELKRRFDTYFYMRSMSGVPLVGVEVKTLLNQGTRSGTGIGEFARSAAMLKGIAWQVFKNVQENMEINKASGIDNPMIRNMQYWGTMMGYGYLVTAMQSLSNGETPPDPTSPETLKIAGLKSGIFGLYGEFVAASMEQNTSTAKDALATTFLGPVFSKAFEYGGAVLGTTLSPENWERAGTFKSANGPVGFFDAIVKGDTNKLSKDLGYLYRQLPGNNILPLDIAVKYFWLDNMREVSDPRYKAKREKSFDKKEGFLFRPRELKDITE